jgi:hypothetical protein
MLVLLAHALFNHWDDTVFATIHTASATIKANTCCRRVVDLLGSGFSIILSFHPPAKGT